MHFQVKVGYALVSNSQSNEKGIRGGKNRTQDSPLSADMADSIKSLVQVCFSKHYNSRVTSSTSEITRDMRWFQK